MEATEIVPKMECTSALPLKNILKKWTRIVCKLVQDRNWKESGKLPPWLYNERADVSLFAGAVWRSMEYAFEEFQEEKRKLTKRRKRLSHHYRGRTDMFFTVGRQRFIVEAKQCSPGMGAGGNETKIEHALAKARLSVKQTKRRRQRQLAVVFVTPYVNKKKHRRDLNQRLGNWLKAARKIPCSARAWVFPQETRFLRYGDRYYPGVFMIIREKNGKKDFI